MMSVAGLCPDGRCAVARCLIHEKPESVLKRWSIFPLYAHSVRAGYVSDPPKDHTKFKGEASKA